ncbi:MAG: helix-turn-helix transcriptional regulator [Coriobacteriales bacterium]|jgi:DNA-binding CsgD family transcriptional regulator
MRTAGGELSGARLARVLASACVLATLPIYSPNIMVLRAHEACDVTGPFVQPLLAVTTFAALATLVASVVRSGRASSRTSGRAGSMACALACLAYAAGTAGYVVIVTSGPTGGAPDAACLACAVLAGVGVVAMGACWSRLYEGLDLRGVVGELSLACLLATVANSLLASASAPVLRACFLAMLATGVLGTLALTVAGRSASIGVERTGEGRVHKHSSNLSVKIDRKRKYSPESDASASNAEGGPLRPGALARAFLSVMGMSLLGMAISSLAMGVEPTQLSRLSVDPQGCGMIVACLVLFAVSRFRVRMPSYTFLFSAVLPCAAALTIVLCSFPEGTLVRDAALLSALTFYSMVTLVAIGTACAVSGAGEFSRWFVMAVLVASFSVFAVLGISLGATVVGLADAHERLVVVLTSAYGCFLLLMGCLRSGTAPAEPSLAASVSDDARPAGKAVSDGGAGEPSFDVRVAQVCQSAALTPRESEILSYLARGHSSVYVAKTLMISESTVYTHVRNMYRKLGVSSREELLGLFGGK